MRERIFDSGPSLFSLHTIRPMLPPPADRDDPRWDAAWEHIGRVYTPALRRYAYARLKARSGGQRPNPEDAETIVQDFLAKAIVSGQLSDAHSKNGTIKTFRAWIAFQLDRAVGAHLEKSRAARNNPGALAPEEVLAHVPAADSDEALQSFDKGVVQIAVERVIARLEKGDGTTKWGSVYAAIIRDLLANEGTTSPDLGARLGVKSSAELATHKNRAKAKCGEYLTEELRKLVRNEDDLAELLRTVDPLLP